LSCFFYLFFVTVIVFSNGHRLVGEPAELAKTRGGAITNVKDLLVRSQPSTVRFNDADVAVRPEHVAVSV
jgi:hypothetical protein